MSGRRLKNGFRGRFYVIYRPFLAERRKTRVKRRYLMLDMVVEVRSGCFCSRGDV